MAVKYLDGQAWENSVDPDQTQQNVVSDHILHHENMPI